MKSFGAASMLFAVTVFGAADDTVAQAFVPTHENLMEFAKASVHAVKNGVPLKLKQKSGLTDDELTELGEDMLLEALTSVDTELFIDLIGDAMMHHVLGTKHHHTAQIPTRKERFPRLRRFRDTPEKSGMPSLERLLTEERRLVKERVSGAIEKISNAHEGIDRRRIVCGGLCIGAGVVGGLFSLASGIFSFWA